MLIIPVKPGLFYMLLRIIKIHISVLRIIIGTKQIRGPKNYIKYNINGINLTVYIMKKKYWHNLCIFFAL
jgi:hypothetical protein